MRLIDADELKDRILIDFDMVKMDDTVVIPCIDFKYNIDNAPTVEAIPVEWVERYIKLHNLQLREDKRHGRGKIIEMQELALSTLKGLLEDWEKENENS